MTSDILGKWDNWYRDGAVVRYGEAESYQRAADFFADGDVSEVEDWGCGTGGFRDYYSGRYTGLDGSGNRYVDKVVDLCKYRSSVDGILLRHVLEHNYAWQPVLQNAVASFRKKLCLVLFTPFAEITHESAHNREYGVDVPDIAFKREDIEYYFAGLHWRLEVLHTGERIYYVERNFKIALINANLGGIDQAVEHVPQSIAHDTFIYTDANFPPRTQSLPPRLQAKLPKCFAWQLNPGYEYYLWLDSSFTLSTPDAVRFFYDACRGYDLVVLQHPERNSIKAELEYTLAHLHEPYFAQRYDGDWVRGQYAAIAADTDYADDLLLCGGLFMYRNTSQVQAALKEWWYHMTRYTIQDQLSFAYVLKKHHLKVNILTDNIFDLPYARWHPHGGA